MPGRSTPPPAPEKTDNTQYYESLGVDKDASQEELKRAWRRAAKKFHPDKGGDNEQFIILCQAYDILRDPQKRRDYDHALPGRCEPSYAAIGCGNRRRRRLKLGKDVTHRLRLSHEELQNGTTKLFRVSHNVICSKCKGKGSKSGVAALVICANCQGSGRKVSVVQLRGRNWRVAYRCRECKGTGKTIDIIDRCPQCKGDKVVPETKVLEVHVEKGMVDAERIIFPEEADEAPGIITGDVVFILAVSDPKRPITLDSEDDSEEDSEEPISFSEEDGEELSSEYEEELSFGIEDSYEDSSYSEEDSEQGFEGQTSSYSEEDIEEDSDVGDFLRQLFEEE